MHNEQLEKRGLALENSFFIQKDRLTISNLNQRKKGLEKLEELKKYTGVKDETVLKNAMDHGLSPSTLYAFIYFPIVYVAWADDLLDNKEKNKIRLISKELGIYYQDDSVAQIEYWLQNPPTEETFKAWKGFFDEYRKNIKPIQLEKLNQQIIERAKSVARSSGIFPFIGDISRKEKIFLDKLNRVLDGDSRSEICVQDFMSTDVYTVNKNTKVENVAKIMLEKNFSVIPVVSNNENLVGLLTESDFIGKNAEIPHSFASIKSLFGQYFYFSEVAPIFEKSKEKKVVEVMTKNPITVTPNCSLTEIVKLMAEKNLKRIPVVDGEKIVGIVTRKDIIRAFLMV